MTAVKWAKMKSKPTYYKGKRKLNTNTTTCLDFNQKLLVVNHWMDVGREGGRGHGTREQHLHPIELLNNKSHGLLPPGGFSSLFFDQVVPYYSQPNLGDQNAIYILH